MERGRRSWSSQLLPTTGFADGAFDRSNGMERAATIPVSSSPSLSPSSSSSPSTGVTYIEHRVTKKDTLAGVAIKYGVEVVDIKRLNGLATDLQMFAHKSLQIPFPGRHPPSSFVSDDSVNNGEQTPRRPHDDILDSLQSLRLNPPRHKVSPSTSLLQGYYGLTPPKSRPILESTEMTVNGTGKSLVFSDDESLFREAPNFDPLPNQHRKCRSRVNGFTPENGKITEDRTTADNSDVERSIRRHQKSVALRPGSGARGHMNRSQQNLISIGDSSLAEGLLSVRKSCSTPDLDDFDGSPIRSASKWNLRPNSFALLFFDGFPLPASWRNKAARD